MMVRGLQFDTRQVIDIAAAGVRAGPAGPYPQTLDIPAFCLRGLAVRAPLEPPKGVPAPLEGWRGLLASNLYQEAR